MSKPVLSISSRVSMGTVGNSLIETAFHRVAPSIPLYTIDSVTWTAPGNHPRRIGNTMDADQLREMMEMLAAPEHLQGGGAAHFLTGYLRTPEQVRAVAAGLQAAATEESCVVVDPVLGDLGRLFVEPATAEAVRKELLPRAGVILPNLTEWAYLTTGSVALTDRVTALLGAADALLKLHQNLKAIIVKSVPFDEAGQPTMAGNQIGLRVIERGQQPIDVYTDALPLRSNGTGDLFSGIFTAHWIVGSSITAAARLAHDGVVGALRGMVSNPALGIRSAYLHR